MDIYKVFTIEYCPFCDSEQVIWAEGITACPHCGKPLAPCSVCEKCSYFNCPYGCDGTENDEHKVVTRPLIPEEISMALYRCL